MTFFNELPGKQDKDAELLKHYIGQLSCSIMNHVSQIDANGGKQACLLVVFNSYDRDLYCINKSDHEQMQHLLRYIPKGQRIPSKLGSFEMEQFPFPLSRVITEIKHELEDLGSKKNNVNIVTVPIYSHPWYGIFNKQPDSSKLKVVGSCQTIEIDLFW